MSEIFLKYDPNGLHSCPNCGAACDQSLFVCPSCGVNITAFRAQVAPKPITKVRFVGSTPKLIELLGLYFLQLFLVIALISMITVFIWNIQQRFILQQRVKIQNQVTLLHQCTIQNNSDCVNSTLAELIRLDAEDNVKEQFIDFKLQQAQLAINFREWQKAEQSILESLEVFPNELALRLSLHDLYQQWEADEDVLKSWFTRIRFSFYRNRYPLNEK
jgi:uncharacterized membrane protein YvbJ